ncbi:MAG: zf-HC2 domain-containing protein [Acetivibrionales bacterium]|jgi:hypothetical protein
MKNCNEIMDMITLYIDNRLGKDERNEFEEHLASCRYCKEEYEDTLEIVSLCRNIPELSLPEGFKNQLHEKLVQEKESSARKVTPLGKKYVKIFTALAAGLLLVFIMQGLFGNMVFDIHKNTGREMLESDESGYAPSEADTKAASKVEEGSQEFEFAAAGENSQITAFIEGEAEKLQESVEAKPIGAGRNGSDAERVIENSRIVVVSDGIDSNHGAQMDAVKNIARKYGAEFFENERSINNQTGDQLNLTINSLSFSVPNNFYEKFESELLLEFGQEKIETYVLTAEEQKAIADSLNSEIYNIEAEIEELEKDKDISNPETYRFLEIKHEYLKNELDKVRQDNEFVLVLIEFGN